MCVDTVPIPADNKGQNTKGMVHIIRVSSLKKNSSSGDSTEKKSAITTVTHGKWFMLTELL